MVSYYVFKYFVLDKFITGDDRDLPWVNDSMKKKFKWNEQSVVSAKILRKMVKKSEKYELLIKVVSEVSQLIEKSKHEYYYCLQGLI